MSKFTSHKTVNKKFPEGLLLPARFRSVHMDTLLSHEPTGEDL